MKYNAFRLLFVLVTLTIALLLNNVARVAAAASTPSVETTLATTYTPKCYFAGFAYPLGSRRNLLPPIEGYWQCELVFRVGSTSAEWVLHLT